jgi:hypothetical protein
MTAPRSRTEIASPITGAIFVTAISGANISPASIASNYLGLREGFKALQALGITITPFPLKVLFV